jgi:hypothetical protein
MAAGPARDEEVGEVRARRRLRDGAIGALVLVSLQNAAGIFLNLYVTVHDTSSDAGVFPAMFASVAGALHVILAIVLLVGGVTMILIARKLPDRRLFALTLFAIAALVVAAYSGYHFVVSGETGYSFAMEMAFLTMVLCEGFILAVLLSPPDRSRPHGVLGTPTESGTPSVGTARPGA